MSVEHGDALIIPDWITALPDAGAEFMIGEEGGASDIINRPAKANFAFIKQLVSGAIGPNLLNNGSFAFWSAGPSSAPDGWSLSGTGASVARSTTKKRGSYAAQLTYGSANALLIQDYLYFADFQGNKVTVGVWAICSTVNRARIEIADGVGNVFSDYHSGGGDGELLVATLSVDASATVLRVSCHVDGGAGTAIFDIVKLEEGEVSTAFDLHPQDFLPQGRKGADVASANNLVLGTDGDYFDITGTTTINSIGPVKVGTEVTLQFDGILTLTHHATNLVLPDSTNIITAAGDEATFREYAPSDWRCINYSANATFKVGYFGRDTATATGTQAVTGVGFQPKAVIFIGGQSATSKVSWGFSDGANHMCVQDHNAVAGNQYGVKTTKAIFIEHSATDYYEGEIQSFDSDGFTVSWTKTGSPTGIVNILYLAIR